MLERDELAWAGEGWASPAPRLHGLVQHCSGRSTSSLLAQEVLEAEVRSSQPCGDYHPICVTLVTSDISFVP